MSAHTSPNYSDLEDAFITDANFKVDMSQKMKVPNKISFNAEHHNGMHDWHENIDMHVPERIQVAGQHQHIGTRAPPREIVYDNSLIVSDPYPGDVRVSTPPRTLTLDRYPFPGLNNYEEKEPERIPVVRAAKFNLNDSNLERSLVHRESTPPIGAGGEGLSLNDEVLHLRRQVAKLNRRVTNLEDEHLNMLQKEKILYGLGIAYFLLKTIVWLNKN